MGESGIEINIEQLVGALAIAFASVESKKIWNELQNLVVMAFSIRLNTEKVSKIIDKFRRYTC